MGKSPAVLVFDLGLTNCKGVVYSADGQALAQASVSYPTHSPETGFAEQDPEDWWQAVCTVTGEMLAEQPQIANRIESISVTGHMHALVGVERDGRPVANAIVLGDQRSIESARKLTQEAGLKTIYQITGARMEEAMPAAKIHWLKSHAPEVFRSADLFTGCKDYLRGLLTGDRLTDPIDACAMSLYDLQARSWSEELLRLAGITLARLPEITSPSALAGRLRAESARALGLRQGLPVVVGSGDDIEVLGSGLMASGCAEEHLGTTGSILTCSAELVFDAAMALEIYPHADPGLWVIGGSITSAGAALSWASNLLGYGGLGDTLSHEVDLAAPPSASSLIFVPHLSGERCPNWNPRVRGAWLGLSPAHTREDLMRAAFEGTAHALNSILRRIEALVGEQRQIFVARRSSDSQEWLQLRANVYRRPLGVVNTGEPTALGAMILGAVGVGLHSDLLTAVDAVTAVVDSIEPQEDSALSVGRKFDLYEQLQVGLLPIWQALHDQGDGTDLVDGAGITRSQGRHG